MRLRSNSPTFGKTTDLVKAVLFLEHLKWKQSSQLKMRSHFSIKIELSYFSVLLLMNSKSSTITQQTSHYTNKNIRRTSLNFEAYLLFSTKLIHIPPPQKKYLFYQNVTFKTVYTILWIVWPIVCSKTTLLQRVERFYRLIPIDFPPECGRNLHLYVRYRRGDLAE